MAITFSSTFAAPQKYVQMSWTTRMACILLSGEYAAPLAHSNFPRPLTRADRRANHARWSTQRPQTYQSGQYYIAVSLFGLNLPGSPFPVYVFAPHAHAPQCEVSGEALTKAYARSKNTFEIRFRDKLGQVSDAMDIDVFAELQSIAERPLSARQVDRSPKSRTPLSRSALTASSATASPVSSRSASPSPSPQPTKRSHRRPTTSPPKPKKLLLPVHRTERVAGTESERAVRKLPEELKRNAAATGSSTTRPAGGRGMLVGVSETLPPQSLESERARLDVAKRQQHSQMWSRRETTDRLPLKNEKGMVTSRGLWCARSVAHTPS